MPSGIDTDKIGVGQGCTAAIENRMPSEVKVASRLLAALVSKPSPKTRICAADAG